MFVRIGEDWFSNFFNWFDLFSSVYVDGVKGSGFYFDDELDIFLVFGFFSVK